MGLRTNALDGLDPDQLEVATAAYTLLRVKAGAGSGKTRCLTARVRHLLDSGVPGHSILTVTFSKKAAEELQQRLGTDIGQVRIGTLHSLGYEIARSCVPHYEQRRVADEGQRRRFLRQVLIDSKSRLKFSELKAAVSRAKARGHRNYAGEARTLGAAYDKLLESARLWDFDDLLLVPVEHFRADPMVRARWMGTWRYLLVDEAQDTSALQWELLSYLTLPGLSVFIVGDQMQGIYRFRGAEPDMMVSFADQMHGEPFNELSLPRNYRSVPEVVEVANRVAKVRAGSFMDAVEDTAPANGRQYGLELQSQRPSGAAVRARQYLTDGDEADEVMRELHRWHDVDGINWGAMAVLYRTNAQSEPFESRLIAEGVPYVITGATAFYARAEVQDVLAYLRTIGHMGEEPSPDVCEALDRIYGRPTRYLGRAWREELERKGGWGALWRGEIGHWSRDYMREKTDRLVNDLEVLGRLGGEPAKAVSYVLDTIGYVDWLKGEDPDSEDNVRVENVTQLRVAAHRFKTVTDLLAFAEQAVKKAPREETGEFDRVTLSSIHRSKGLEWSAVALVGLTDGVLPHVRAIQGGDLDEELRCLYVGVTRARDHLLVTGHEPPSRFWEALGLQVEGVAEDAEDGEAGVAAAADGAGAVPAGGHDHGQDDAADGGSGPVRADVGVRGPDDGEPEAGRAARGDVSGMPGRVAGADGGA